MNYFPVCLDITGRRCLVIGGGHVAERKVRGLLACEAKVTVISPELNNGLTQLHEADGLLWLARSYQYGDLAGAFLVIAATDDAEAQAAIYQEAEAGNILLNVADVPKWCNFILPATVTRGELKVSVSTGGNSPALARQIRKKLEKTFGEEYEILLKIMGVLRSYVLAAGLEQQDNKRIFEALLMEDLAGWIADRQWQKIEAHIGKILGSHCHPQCLIDVRECYSPAKNSA